MKFHRKATVLFSALAILGGVAVCDLPVTADNAAIAYAASTNQLTISKSVLSLGKGESFRLTANKSVKWRTSAPKIVTVDSKGNVKAVGIGTARVTGKATDGTEKSCKITVKKAPSKITLSKGIVTIGVGEKFSVTSSIPNGTACAKRTYRTSNSSVVKMTRTNWQGDFVGVKPGVAYVTVRSYNGKESTCKVTVKKAPTWVSISKKTLTMTVGDTATLSAGIASNAGCAKRTYRTSNSSIVKMTKTSWAGNFKAVKPGTAYVTVRTYNGKEASCKITVKAKNIPVTGIKLNKSNVDLSVGDTAALTATVSPSNATNKSVTWKSSNTSIATVSNGKVTAKKAGTAVITAKSNNGKTATCKVTITHVHNWVAQTKTVHHDATYKYEDVYEDYIEKIYYSGVCANDSLLNQEGYVKDPHTGKISFSKDYLGHEKYSLTPWGIQTPWWMLFEKYNLCTLDDILNCKYDWVTVETKERKYEDYEPEFYENGYTKEVQVIYHISYSGLPDEWSSKCLDYWGSTTTKKSLIKSIPHHKKVGTKTVIDKAAYDETVITGYKCSCGATK